MDWKQSCRTRLPKFLDGNGDLAPPWEQFPAYERWPQEGGTMNVLYDCRVLTGYSERSYCIRRGDDAFLIWEGYVWDLMDGMWRVYGWEFDPDKPGDKHLGQVPLLREWNERGWSGADGPVAIADLPATVQAFRDAVADLRRAGPNLTESPQHGEALAAFLEQAVAGQLITVEEWWG